MSVAEPWGAHPDASECPDDADAAFPGYPPNTVGVRRDGTFLVVPGEPGDLRALDGTANPEFFDHTGRSLGIIEVSGVTDSPQTCALFAISNLSKVRGAAYLMVWYLTRYTTAPSLEIGSVNPDTLGRLLRRLGMAGVARCNDMVGGTDAVHAEARNKCWKHGWHLRGDPLPPHL
jgi:hypothetical protein